MNELRILLVLNVSVINLMYVYYCYIELKRLLYNLDRVEKQLNPLDMVLSPFFLLSLH